MIDESTSLKKARQLMRERKHKVLSDDKPRKYLEQPPIDFSILILLLVHRGFPRLLISEYTGVSVYALLKYTNSKTIQPRLTSAREIWNFAVMVLDDNDLDRCVLHD